MKNVLKRLAIIVPIVLAIFFISFAYEDKTRTEYRTVYEEQPLIYVTRTGDCYHSYGCRYLSRSRIPKGLYQAEESGYRCCSVCDGVAFETMQVAIREPYEVEDYSVAIFFSIAKVVFFAPFLCIPIFRLLDRIHFRKKDE